MTTLAKCANAAWFAAGFPEWLRFRNAATSVEATQRALLRHYLKRNADTEFGREHRFARIHSWEDYAERVPARAYDEFEPWIGRIADGHANILTAERVDRLAPSSGSTGAEKWLPYTRTLHAELRRAVAVWLTQNAIDCPQLLGGRAYWSLTPLPNRDGNRQSRVPIGFDDDSSYLGGVLRRLIDYSLATPPALRNVADMDAFWRLTLLHLLKCKDLRLISVWHPSYLGLLLRHLQNGWSQLMRDLDSGFSLSRPALHIAADPARAVELDALGPENAKAIWPELALISCWADAQAATGIDQIRRAFPGVRIQPKGLIATEAFVTLPYKAHRPLAIRSHFFEFIDGEGHPRPAWELKSGQEYAVVVTTGGGLYRYRLRDRVQVTGFIGGIPSACFLGKEDNVADHFGEKLSEDFVVSVLKTVFARHGVTAQFAMIAIDRNAATPGYVLYLQAENPVAAGLGRAVDAALRRNPHYDLCVRLGQLVPLRVTRVANRAYDIYARRLSEGGMRLGDIKPAALSRLGGWPEYFKAATATRASHGRRP